MASVTLNPILTSLSGNIGRIVFYRRWKNIYARVYVIPRNPDTEKQRANRTLFRDAMTSWKGLSPEDKKRYNMRAIKLPMTGHNLYISEYMKKHIADRAHNLSQKTDAGIPQGSSRISSQYLQAIRSVTTPSIPVTQVYSGNIPPLYNTFPG